MMIILMMHFKRVILLKSSHDQFRATFFLITFFHRGKFLFLFLLLLFDARFAKFGSANRRATSRLHGNVADDPSAMSRAALPRASISHVIPTKTPSSADHHRPDD